MNDAQVVIAGGGLAGCIIACLLRDRGIDVVIIDRHDEVMQGASRWNEGKIHLGYTYVGTGSVRTAQLMLAGAAAFRPLVERVIGGTLEDELFTRSIIYLVDVNSIFPSDVLWQRTQTVHAMVEKAAVRHPWITAGVEDKRLTRLDPDHAAEATRQSRFVAAWSTPERAVSTRVLADRVAAAVRERGIPIVRGEVDTVDFRGSSWCISLADGASVQGRIVVNALWEDRSRIDRKFTQKVGPVSIRWKAAIFARGQPQFAGIMPSTRILGGYGDITPYGNGDVYLSWYPANMIARSDNGTPPPVPEFDRAEMLRSTLDGLRFTEDILRSADPDSWVRGGYVVARGEGDIYETTSPLHDRSAAFAVELSPGLISVDASKLTTAPLLSERAARLVLGRLGLEAMA